MIKLDKNKLKLCCKNLKNICIVKVISRDMYYICAGNKTIKLLILIRQNFIEAHNIATILSLKLNMEYIHGLTYLFPRISLYNTRIDFTKKIVKWSAENHVA